MKINLSFEDALKKASPRLQRQMEHTKDVILKALPLAKMYDPDKGFYVGMSFGKDSQAVYHMMQLCNVPFFAYFSPTSIDPPEVIRFGRSNYPEVEFVKLTTNIFEVFKSMKVLPSMKIRWCCAHFKERGGEGKVVCTGVRKAESVKRSRRNEIEVSGRKFSGHMDEFDEWQEKRIRRKMKNLNQDQFSDAKESEVRCINGNDKILLNPIIEWSEQDVWEFLNNVVEVPHCELYDQGWTRIGCILCPMASVKHAPRDIERWPHVKEKWIKAIMDVRKESILANTPYQNQSIKSSLSTDCTPPHKQTLEGRNRQRTGEPVRIPPRFPSWGTQYDRMGTARRRNDRDVQQLQERLLEGMSNCPPPKSRIGEERKTSQRQDLSTGCGRENF